MQLEKKDLFKVLQPIVSKAVRIGITELLKDCPEDKNIIRGTSGLAKFLGVTKPTVIRMIKAGNFPYHVIGKTYIFKADEILSAMRVEPGQEMKYESEVYKTVKK